jgi:flagellar motility protein MotE (MotC chaperone)
LKTVALPQGEEPDLGSETMPNSSRDAAVGAEYAAKAVGIEIVLTESAVKRKSFSDTMQRPEVLLPCAMCALSVGYLILLSPMFGWFLPALGVMIASGGLTVALLSWRYPREHERNSQELADRMEEHRLLLEKAQLAQLHETLRVGFAAISSYDGVRALQALSNEYHDLMNSLDQKRSTDPLAVSVLPGLAEEIYRRGMSVLSDALELMNVLRTPSKEKLQREVEVIDDDIRRLKPDRSQDERLRLKEELLASFRERISALDRLEIFIEQLLHQARRCEASLQSARVELATVRAGGAKTSIDSVIDALKQRIDQVREVQEEVARLGY